MEALIGLAGAVIGGILVMIGDRLSERRQDRKQALRLAWESAATILGNKRRLRRLCVAARSAGRSSLTAEESESVASDSGDDARFYMLPVGEPLRLAMRRVHSAGWRLEDGLSASDTAFAAGEVELRQAMFDFEAEMRTRLGERDVKTRIAESLQRGERDPTIDAG